MTSDEPPAKRPRGLGANKKAVEPEKPEAQEEILYQCEEGADEMTEFKSMWETAKKAFWREEKGDQVTMLLRAVIHEYDRMAREKPSDEIAEICGEALLLLAHYEERDGHLETILEICTDDSEISRLVREIQSKEGQQSPLAVWHASQFGMEREMQLTPKELISTTLPPLCAVELAEQLLNSFFDNSDDDEDDSDVDQDELHEYEQLVKHICDIITENEATLFGSGWLHACGDFYLLAGAVYSCLDQTDQESEFYVRTKHFYQLIFEHHGEEIPQAIQEL